MTDFKTLSEKRAKQEFFLSCCLFDKCCNKLLNSSVKQEKKVTEGSKYNSEDVCAFQYPYYHTIYMPEKDQS